MTNSATATDSVKYGGRSQSIRTMTTLYGLPTSSIRTSTSNTATTRSKSTRSEVVGVDIQPQPNYPFQFIQNDALDLDPKFVASFDAIHASPPCQSYSDLAKRNRNADAWPRLISPVRTMLINTGLPYVIENVD